MELTFSLCHFLHEAQFILQIFLVDCSIHLTLLKLFAGEVDELVNAIKAISLQAADGDKSMEIYCVLKKLIKSVESNAAAYNNIDLTDAFTKLLSRSKINASEREQVDRTIAEITKNDCQRKLFTNDTIIGYLLNYLAEISQQKQQQSEPGKLSDAQLGATIQSCRALGNICYNNEDARNIILKLNGDAIIINLLDIKLNASNEVHVTFGKFRGGLLSNYLLGGEHLAKNAMELKIIDKIEQILDDCIASGDIEKHEAILLSTLQPLSLLTENVTDLNFSPKLNGQLAKILTISKDPDLAEICLEMLNYQAECGMEG